MLRMILGAGLISLFFAGCIPYSQIRKSNDNYILMKKDGTTYQCSTIAMNGLACVEE